MNIYFKKSRITKHYLEKSKQVKRIKICRAKGWVVGRGDVEEQTLASPEGPLGRGMTSPEMGNSLTRSRQSKEPRVAELQRMGGQTSSKTGCGD